MKFPYRKYQVDSSASVPKGVLYRPMIPLRVIGATGEKVVLALADSGADETMFPRSLGNALGIPFDEDATLAVGGIALALRMPIKWLAMALADGFMVYSSDRM